MKILVVGLGSMGERRIRLLRQNYPEYQIAGVDHNRERTERICRNYNIKTFFDFDRAVEETMPDAAFICTSPLSHSKFVFQCLNSNIHVFTEINLTNNEHNQLIKLANEKNLVLFLSSTMLYRKETQYILNRVNQYDNLIHYHYHVGQYLPDWHPWEDYHDFFISDRRTNGCREIFAIELPWIIRTFGEITSFTVKKDVLTQLGLDFPDSFLLMVEHKRGHKGILNIDIVSRCAVRELEVISENIYIKWNGKPDGLYDFSLQRKILENINLYCNDEINHEKRYADNIIENAYLDEIKTFFEKLNNNYNEVLYTMEEEIKVLDLIDKIEGV